MSWAAPTRGLCPEIRRTISDGRPARSAIALKRRRDHHHPGTRVPPPPSRHDGLPDPFRATGDARALAWGVGTTDRVVRLEEVGATGPPAVAKLPRSYFVGVVFRQVVPHHNECAGRKLKALLVRFRAVRVIMRPRRSAIDPAPRERRRDWPRAI